MDTKFVFSGDKKLLEELETFFTAYGIKAEVKRQNIVRAKESDPEHPLPPKKEWITVIAKAADVAIALLEFLGGKTIEGSLSFGTGETSVEVSKSIEVSAKDKPKKLERYFQKNEGFYFNVKIKL